MNGSSKYITLKADPDNPEDSREVKIYYSTVEAKSKRIKRNLSSILWGDLVGWHFCHRCNIGNDRF